MRFKKTPQKNNNLNRENNLFSISGPKTGQCLTDIMSVPPEASTSFD